MSENNQLSSQLTVVAPMVVNAEQTAFREALDAAARPAASTNAALAAALTPATLNPAAFHATLPADAPTPLIGPEPATFRVSASELPSLRGVALLDQLALLDPSQLSRFVTKHSATVAALIANPPAAAAVASEWASWPQATRLLMVKQAPQLVGSLDGMPYAQRNVANRSFLASSEAAIRVQLASDSVGRAAKDELSKRLHMLQQVRDAVKKGASGNERTLVSLDATGEGRAVIAVGDPSTADYVDYLIPGMFSDVDTQIQVLAGGADSIATAQQTWLKELNPGTPASQLPTVATIAWIGYQTPNIVNVASMSLAREGQQSLTSSIEGLRAVRAARVVTHADGTVTGAQPFVAVLAHSYGSTAAMLSLQNDQVSVDALAIVGSPGSPARTAGQLNVTNGNVWVGAGATDPVPQTGLFGSQPTSAAYGAHRFGVDGAVDPLTGKSMGSVVGHDGYFVNGTESLRNMVLIGIGRGDLVLGLDGSSALALSRAHGTAPRGPRV
ncbi:MAG: alpha/beta hydrolase family protein [Actinomycetota bacterium]|nr:alpha/beta hydrolase family protein [Actinomycetota bacterium]